MTTGRSRARTLGAVVAAGLFVLTSAAFMRPPLLPDIGRDLGLTAVGLGLLGSVFAMGRLLADLPAGRMTDRVGVGRMMMLSGVIVAAGSAMLAAAPGGLVAYLAMFVLGLGSTMVLTAAQAHFARAPRARRGASLAVFGAALLVGQSVGPAIGGAMGANLGWRTAMMVGASLAIAVALLFLVVRLRPVEQDRKKVEKGPPPPIPRRVLAFVYLLPAVQFAVGAALAQTLVPIVADEELGIGAGTVGLALGFGGLCRLLAAVVSGQVSDRVSRRWAMVPGQAIQAIGVGVFLIGGPVAWFVAIVLVMLGSAGVNVGTTILADLSEGGEMGGRLGAFRFTGDMAFVVAPLLSGWLYEVAGRQAATLPLLIFAVVVTIGATVFIPETRT